MTIGMSGRPLARLSPRAALFAIAVVAVAVLALPAARAALERSMTLHMLVQIPLLGAAGFAIALALPPPRRAALRTAAGGPWPLILVATFASSYWMLPRALDAALLDPLAELAKFVSLPLLVGLPLGIAWERLGLVGRGFVWTNFISMLAVLGWLYLAAPMRVCNGYLLEQQDSAGAAMVKLAIALLGGWLASLFVGRPDASLGASPVQSRQTWSPMH